MDRVTLAVLLVIGAAIAHGVYLSTSSCSMMSVESTDEGQRPAEETCVQEFSPAPFVLMAFMLLAGIGVWMRQPVMAWAGAIPALAGCIVMGLSWGGVLIFHSVAVLAAVGVWHRWGRRPATSQVSRRAFATIFSIPLGLLALINLGYGLPALFDPCVQWDHNNTMTIGPDDPCRSKTSYGQTRSEYVTEMVTWEIIPLTAATVAGIGAWRGKRELLFTAAVLWCVQAMVYVMGFGYPLVPIAVAAAVACFLAARQSTQVSQPPPPPPPESSLS